MIGSECRSTDNQYESERTMRMKGEKSAMERNELPRMRSIREIAQTGLLSEYALRRMEKNGELPCVHVGKKCLVNLDKLIELLNHPGGIRDSR